MRRGVRSAATLRAEVGIDATQTKEVGLQPGTVARAKLRQSGADGTRKEGFRRVDKRRRSIEDSIGKESIDGFPDNLRVDVRDGLLEITRPDNAIDEERLHVRPNLRTKRVLHGTRTAVPEGDDVRRMVRLHSAGEEWRRKKSMLLHRQQLSLGVDVVRRRRSMATRGEAKSLILHYLKTSERSGGILRKYDGSGVIQNWSNEGLVRRHQTLLVVAKRRVREGS